MARVRWVKSPEQLRRDADRTPELLPSTVSSLRVVYETAPAIAAAVVPRPLEPAARPEVCVTFSQVTVHLGPDLTLGIGSAVFGVRARHEGVEGMWLLTMPMTSEQAVIGGRDTYGEPKKLAEITFRRDGDRVSASVARMGIPYLEAQGTLAESLGPREFVEYGFCAKASPSCEKGKAFDGDPLLVCLEWRHRHERVHRVDGEIALRESPFDPVADLPVCRLVRMEYEEGSAQSSGRVLRAIPAEWFAPFVHGRYDDPRVEGVEVADR